MSYIKREAIHKMLDELLDINIGVGAMLSEDCVRELINDTPAADVVPREEVEYLKKENRYLRDRLAEEMEHAKDMKGIDV